MEKFTKQFISYFLLSLFITAIVPEVFIHAFAPHEDSIDLHSSKSSISDQHIHCEHLFDEMPSSQLDDCLYLIVLPILLFKIENVIPISISLILSETVVLRGPPFLA